MKEAFIGKGFGHEYICFTRYKMRGEVAEVHSEANKYDVTKYVNVAIANWIGERVGKMKKDKLTDEEFGQLIGKDFNKLQEECVQAHDYAPQGDDDGK